MKLKVSLFFALSQLLAPVSFVDAVHEKVMMSRDPAHKGESFIVVFKKSLSTASADDVEAKRNAIVADFPDVSVTHTFSSALTGFSAKMSVAEAEAMADSPDVAYIEQDGMVYASEIWNLDRIDERVKTMDNTYNPFFGDGSNTTVYVLDTGVQISHNEFGNRADWGENTSGDGDDRDCHGHGTHVAGSAAGSLYGVAKGANIIAVKVLTCSGSGSTAGVIAGVEWVQNDAQNKKAVANMSLGGGYSQSLNNAVGNLVDSGVQTVVAAGNDNGDACSKSPASEPKAITVGSTDNSDARSWFSNYGKCVDIMAPGSDIKAAWIGDDDATNTISGTSMASPHVAGAVAMLLGDGVPTSVVEAQLIGHATRNMISDMPYATPNKLLYVGEDTNPPTPAPTPTIAPSAAPSIPCVDDPVGWYDSFGDGCGWYAEGDRCEQYGDCCAHSDFGTTANQACCVCGGGKDPDDSESPSEAPSPTKPSCVDSKAWFIVSLLKDKPLYNCKAVSNLGTRNKQRVCSKDYNTAVACPVICNTCDKFEKSELASTFYNSKTDTNKKSCKQLYKLSKSKKEERCNQSPLWATTCRAQCKEFLS